MEGNGVGCHLGSLTLGQGLVLDVRILFREFSVID